MTKSSLLLILFSCLLSPQSTLADITRLLEAPTLLALAEESSGVEAKRNLDTITLYHRTRASSQFRSAAEHVYKSLHSYGMTDVEMLQYSADGKTLFGTQKSRPAWNVDFAELWELDPQGERVKRYASWSTASTTSARSTAGYL